jgi:hypothetical protein
MQLHIGYNQYFTKRMIYFRDVVHIAMEKIKDSKKKEGKKASCT